MPINPQINDMPWFGKPADPVGAYQQGQNLAEQSQRMSQSRDMHPLKMADLKSATSARDQHTSLNAQRERFNDLNQDSLLRHSAASASSAESAATVSKNTITAQTGLVNSANVIQGVKSRMAAANEQTGILAQEARNLQVASDANIAIRTAGDKIRTSAARTSMEEDRSVMSSATLGLDIDNAHLINQQNKNSLEMQGIQVKAALRKEAARADGAPNVGMYKGQMDLAYEAGYHDIIDNMIFSGVTAPQETELEAYRSSIRQTNNYVKYTQSRNAANAMMGEEQQQGIDNWATLKPKQRGMFEAKGADGKPLYTNQDGTLNDDGLDLADRTNKWNKLTEGMRDTDKLKISNAILKLDGSVGVYSANQKKSRSFMTSYYAGSTPQANPFGEFVKGEFVPNGAGLDEAADLVKSFKAQQAAQQAAANLSMVKGEGHVVKGFTINPDGSITYETERGYSTQAEIAPRILAELKVLRGENETRDKPLTDIQMIKEAKDRVYGTEMKFALNAAEARGQGLEIGDTFFNANPAVMKVQRLVDPATLPATPPSTPTQGQEGQSKAGNKGNKAYQESSADDEFKERAKPPSPPSSKKLVGTPYLVDRLKKGNRRWTSFDKKMLHNAGWNPDTGERLRAAGGSTKAKPTIKEATPQQQGLPNQYDTGPLRDLGISATDPSMDDITLRSARQSLRLGRPLSREEANALVNKHPIPKDMPAENIRVINAARRGEKLPPQDKEWLREMNINPETGIPMGKVKIVRLPPRPTLRPKK